MAAIVPAIFMRSMTEPIRHRSWRGHGADHAASERGCREHGDASILGPVSDAQSIVREVSPILVTSSEAAMYPLQMSQLSTVPHVSKLPRLPNVDHIGAESDIAHQQSEEGCTPAPRRRPQYPI
jgi:hypothetical protein